MKQFQCMAVAYIMLRWVATLVICFFGQPLSSLAKFRQIISMITVTAVFMVIGVSEFFLQPKKEIAAIPQEQAQTLPVVYKSITIDYNDSQKKAMSRAKELQKNTSYEQGFCDALALVKYGNYGTYNVNLANGVSIDCTAGEVK